MEFLFFINIQQLTVRNAFIGEHLLILLHSYPPFLSDDLGNQAYIARFPVQKSFRLSVGFATIII